MNLNENLLKIDFWLAKNSFIDIIENVDSDGNIVFDVSNYMK